MSVETQVEPTPRNSIPHGYDKRLMLAAGRASQDLGHKIAEKVGVPLTPSEVPRW